VNISPELLEQLVAACTTAVPHEACGLLLGRNETVYDVVPAENISDRPAHDYVIPSSFVAATVVDAVRLGLRLVGGYHSHPTGSPTLSKTDAAHSPHPDWVHVVVGLRGEPTWAGWRVPEIGGPVEVPIEVHHS
jgi:proteasome lid subunit RPN8/RPN11